MENGEEKRKSDRIYSEMESLKIIFIIFSFNRFQLRHTWPITFI